MALLTRDEILRIQGMRTEEVDVPEWGGQVLVRELPAAVVSRIGMGLAARGIGSDEDTESGYGRTVVLEEISDQFPTIVAASVITVSTRAPACVSLLARSAAL